MARILFFTLAITALQTGLAVGQNCAYGANTCNQGFVWRQAYTGDYVCVTPATRSQAWADNAAAASRVSPDGGAYGPDTCLQGYVWRQADPSDFVCVTPATRTQTAEDNNQAVFRVECNCGSSWTECTQEWFGTAPFCDGDCPAGWRFIRSSGSASSCDPSQEGLCITCEGTSGNSCWTGNKVLCEEECVGVIQES